MSKKFMTYRTEEVDEGLIPLNPDGSVNYNDITLYHTYKKLPIHRIHVVNQYVALLCVNVLDLPIGNYCYSVSMEDVKKLDPYGTTKAICFEVPCSDGTYKQSTSYDIQLGPWQISKTSETYVDITFGNVNINFNTRKGVNNADDVVYKATGINKYLSVNNTYEYTPTNDYNPATKKYVDDVIAAALGAPS